MKYLHVQVTNGYTYREVVGTQEEIDALGENPRPETRVQTFATCEAFSWEAAMEHFGFTPGDQMRLGR